MVIYGGLKRNRDDEDHINGIIGPSGICGAGHGQEIIGNGTVFPTAGLVLEGEDQDIDLTRPRMSEQLSTATGTVVRVQAGMAAPVMALTAAEMVATSLSLSSPAPPLPHPGFIPAPTYRSRTGQWNRRRRLPIPEGRSEIVEQPYPWAMDRRATVHTLEYLLSHNLNKISGDVHCKVCKHNYKMEYDLQEKLRQVGHYIAVNEECMNERAPPTWMKPVLPTCNFCQNNVKPKIEEKNETINWLFLFLGQLLGCCTMEQLKYFCKHNGHITTSAKDRLLFHTYLGIYKQLNPD